MPPEAPRERFLCWYLRFWYGRYTEFLQRVATDRYVGQVSLDREGPYEANFFNTRLISRLDKMCGLPVSKAW